MDRLSHTWEDGFSSSNEADDGEFQVEDSPAAIRCFVDLTKSHHRLQIFDSSWFRFRNNRDKHDNDDDDDNV